MKLYSILIRECYVFRRHCYTLDFTHVCLACQFHYLHDVKHSKQYAVDSFMMTLVKVSVIPFGQRHLHGLQFLVDIIHRHPFVGYITKK